MGQWEVERAMQVSDVNASGNEQVRHFMEADARKTIRLSSFLIANS